MLAQARAVTTLVGLAVAEWDRDVWEWLTDVAFDLALEPELS